MITSRNPTRRTDTFRRLLARSLAMSALALAATALLNPAKAQTLGYAPEMQLYNPAPNLSAHDATYDEQSDVAPAHLRKSIVAYETREAPGTVVIDTDNT